MPRKLIVTPGDRYAQAVILEEVEPHISPLGKPRRMFRCKCDCGKVFDVLLESLTAGHTKSCGCYRQTKSAEAKTTHGLTKSSEYNSWCGIKARCLDSNTPAFRNYGARGIRVCERYAESVVNIVADIGMKPKPVNGERYSVDRMDNDGHYSCGQCPECLRNGWPMNIQWATDEEQQTHTRQSRFMTFDGRTQTVAQWAREYGMPCKLVRKRYAVLGWSPKRALTEKPFVGKNQTHLRDEETLCPESP